ncbi:MmcQ/YjbR family DNA-binding protein [Blastococcus sp. BMG 814]|uniref:MmcQ/YjbR family DNA-binding protein n=1 Tax=Blastococcus carthaginiensis TaxID=3050034 RepID=A0ABT9II56_9ACTN|nr:MmcQ/YjbR family DNA-binding protein [Blastococcus carthaginiensis]MDP5185266.1 MmcQ/YjbR family DNA-binding protein [Blastococcus carthaginiensis]
MATWEDVRRLVAGLPDTDEHPSYGGHPSWRVRGKAFAWARPLRESERAALCGAAPDEAGPLLGVRVADEGVKASLIAAAPDVFLTTPHFDGYAVVLVRLGRIPVEELAELVEDAWRARAPRRLLAEFDGGGRSS